MWDFLRRLFGGGPAPEAKAKPSDVPRTSSPPSWWISWDVGDGKRLDLPVVAWDELGPLSWWEGGYVRPASPEDVFSSELRRRRWGSYFPPS